jgi:hypothetical protein
MTTPSRRAVVAATTSILPAPAANGPTNGSGALFRASEPVTEPIPGEVMIQRASWRPEKAVFISAARTRA